eukprot:2500901-Karenia_brevis.AAC.1
MTTLSPDPTPTEAASPYIVPSNTEPPKEEELKEEKEELKGESGGALEPSAPPEEKTSKMPSASVATLPSGVKEDVPSPGMLL